MKGPAGGKVTTDPKSSKNDSFELSGAVVYTVDTDVTCYGRVLGVTKRCRLSLLTKSALVIRVQMRGEWVYI